jgi:eukaryotic-like serine/threonine-protein kinase
MLAKLLRGLGLLAYVLMVAAVFVLSAYISFSLFVRSGVTAVPGVKGLTPAEAASSFAEKGLRLRRTEDGRYDDEVPLGRVVRQSPDPRTLVKRGSAVAIVLSLGPRRMEVPDLTGKALPAAQFTLAAIGLGVGRTLAAFAEKNPGQVLEQDPDPKLTVAPATAVDLLVAMPAVGDRYVMPDLVYRHYEEIRPFFERQGFRLGSVKFERYEGVAAGVILRQFPLAGHPLTRQDAVSLVVATAEGLP